MATGKRSPKYPFIPLERALMRAEELYRSEGRNFTPISVATGHWGYKPKSSGGLQTIGALIGYGLLEDEGSRKDRKVRVTELTRRILLDQRPDSEERQDLIKEAALAPSIFSTLWTRWGESGFPSPASMRHSLLFDYNFNERSVDDVIEVITDTFEFAGLTPGDKPRQTESHDEAEGAERGEAGPSPESSGIISPKLGRPRKTEEGMQEATFPLTEGLAVLQWPKALSPESYEDFEAWVRLTLRRAQRSIQRSNGHEEGDKSEPKS